MVKQGNHEMFWAIIVAIYLIAGISVFGILRESFTLSFFAVCIIAWPIIGLVETVDFIKDHYYHFGGSRATPQDNATTLVAFVFIDKHGLYVSFEREGCSISFSQSILSATLYRNKDAAQRSLDYFYDMTLVSDARTLYSGFQLFPVQLTLIKGDNDDH